MSAPKAPWLRVKTAADLQRIRKFVRFAKIYRSNTYTGPRPDKNGSPIICFGHNENPSSDWGKYKGSNGYIWFANEELAEAGEQLVQEALL
jgi:hypothetical protein